VHQTSNTLCIFL